MLLFSCNENQTETSVEVNPDSVVAADTLPTPFDSVAVPMKRIDLPTTYLSESELSNLIEVIDEYVKGGDDQWRMESVYGIDNTPCGIERYYRGDELLLIRSGCGDCSPFMSDEKFYIKNDELIMAAYYFVNYGFNPCWSDEQRTEFGVTEEKAKEMFEERTDVYWLRDSLDIIFSRTGKISDTSLISDDTLVMKDIIREVIWLRNAEEPE